ncbi:MAG: adenylate cyclase [Verrucomicrobia bacterium]|nr:adenylate cyclase [Verrucomicrobiota bacterium]
MSIETERKFLIDALPELQMADPKGIEQGYLVTHAGPHGLEVRVRKIQGESAVLTFKAGAGLSRAEIEVRLDPEAAEALWPFTEDCRVMKRRFALYLSDGHRVDLDIYEGNNSGLVTAEIEFASESAAADFRPPQWFGREITGDPAFSNAALAIRK